MGVVFNGVTITAGTNKFYFNGTSVKNVYFNGVHVWQGLPTFSSGTVYQALHYYRRAEVKEVWETAGTSTFKGGDGSTASVRAIATGSSYDQGEYWTYSYGHGRILKNGSQIAYMKTKSPVDQYGAFSTVTLNYGDVLTFQCYIGAYGSLGGRHNGEGGGQVYFAEDTTGYWE